MLIVVILQLQNDGATLVSSYFSFFYANGFSRFQGKQMKVPTTASLAASLSPVLLLVWKLLKIPTALWCCLVCAEASRGVASCPGIPRPKGWPSSSAWWSMRSMPISIRAGALDGSQPLPVLPKRSGLGEVEATMNLAVEGRGGRSGL